ncbi:alpha/beta hydrolase family protein [Paraferrimonas sedimenticola]|uniref:Peptidase S9 n=1 Tax=Paraferrimonas sedimenticola TaxID=375674 RepID=A0AA37RYZ6_9GAMM|nr:prolyl oligopeptidase family serine peptidase [Paraferrimonas sedimenticola]GLP97909.1 peptidase S9 [Paraferrimonas sedimenticola]
MKSLTLLGSALALALSGSALTAELDKSKMTQLGPITSASAQTLSEGKHADALTANIARHLYQSHTASSLDLFGQTQKWQAVNTSDAKGWVAYQTQISTERFTQGSLTLSGLDAAQVYLNGEKVGAGEEVELSLRNGDYHLLILADGRTEDSELSLDWQGKTDNDQLALSSEGKQRVSAELLFDAPTVGGFSLSPNGQYLIMTKTEYQASKGDKAVKTTELVRVKDNQRVYAWSSQRPSAIAWSGDSEQFAFFADKQVHTMNLKTLEITTLAQGLESVSGLHWYNDNSLLVSWDTPFKADDKATNKRLNALQDRWSYWRNHTQLYQLDVVSGMMRQLTNNPLSNYLLDADAQRGKLLLSRTPVDYKEPAHSLSQLIELDLSTLEETLIGEYRTFGGATYAEDGIYLQAGPNFMKGLGKSAEDLVVNDYDGQLYWRDNQGNVSALSKEFAPAIGEIQKLKNDDLVVKVTDQDRSQLYWFDLSKKRFQRLKTDVDVVNSYSVASDLSKANVAYAGTSATVPQKAFNMQLSNQRKKPLFDSQAIAYSNRKLGEIKDFDFTNELGHEIDGRVYYPADFDADKQYPALVYYYGGTSPVTRSFTGRWPFNLWAAQGYVVYVLQPNGATGYGQEFSGRHVNAWGKYSADDIIAGTKAFLKAHPYVDPKRVGNMGASYGGFMTMYLATKTDIFAASMAHAGISNLSAYWGYGWWGYGYSGIASRGSFPWNNKELYVEQSPLYHADKINTPLLLLHGNADTNVPVAESHYLYTALKLLDKPVELIEFNGQDHHINGRQARFDWWDATLAWFDLHLKEQPEWWQSLYPDSEMGK